MALRLADSTFRCHHSFILEPAEAEVAGGTTKSIVSVYTTVCWDCDIQKDHKISQFFIVKLCSRRSKYCDLK
jgi:hypothetical protein